MLHETKIKAQERNKEDPVHRHHEKIQLVTVELRFARALSSLTACSPEEKNKNSARSSTPGPRAAFARGIGGH
jgi:hypothetical protein